MTAIRSAEAPVSRRTVTPAAMISAPKGVRTSVVRVAGSHDHCRELHRTRPRGQHQLPRPGRSSVRTTANWPSRLLKESGTLAQMAPRSRCSSSLVELSELRCGLRRARRLQRRPSDFACVADRDPGKAGLAGEFGEGAGQGSGGGRNSKGHARKGCEEIWGICVRIVQAVKGERGMRHGYAFRSGVRTVCPMGSRGIEGPIGSSRSSSKANYGGADLPGHGFLNSGERHCCQRSKRGAWTTRTTWCSS